jgi:hypothetical protein
MDPWLESHWGDIHQSIALYARNQIQPKLPPDLRARLEERVFVELPDGPQRVKFSDVRVVERPHRKNGEQAIGLLEPEEPVVGQLRDDPITEGFVEFR